MSGKQVLGEAGISCFVCLTQHREFKRGHSGATFVVAIRCLMRLTRKARVKFVVNEIRDHESSSNQNHLRIRLFRSTLATILFTF